MDNKENGLLQPKCDSEYLKHLNVDGKLNISNTKVTELPNDLTLTFLWAFHSSLKQLPKNLVVFNVLNIKYTPIKSVLSDCLARVIFCDFELNDERYVKKYDYYQLKKDIVHIYHPSGREFLHIDNVLSEVIEKKGNVYYARYGVNGAVTYVVTDGNEHCGYGDTLEDAEEDFFYQSSKR